MSNSIALYADSSTVGVYNSIIVDNQRGLMVGTANGGTLTATYDDVWGNGVGRTFGEGNISTDPLFASWSDDGDADDDDLTLASGSPCIDAGNADPPENDVDGTRNDMGAYGGPGSW